MMRSEFTIEDVARGRTMTITDLHDLGGQVFECNKAHGDALIRAFSTKKYPRLIVVKNALIVSVKVDDRGFVVHKWTKKIVDLKQVYLVIKDNRRIYQLALEFTQRPGEKKPFTDVLQFNPTTSRDFTQTISKLRKELLGSRGGGGGASVSSPNAAVSRNDRQTASFGNTHAESRHNHGHQPPPHHQQERERDTHQQRQSAFGDAIASAEARYQPRGDVGGAPPPARFDGNQFAPVAVSAAAVDPFAPQPSNPFGVVVPPPAHSPRAASGPESVSGSVNFDNMMQSVAANGHQMQTLFDSPSHQSLPVADPFAHMAAPVPQMQHHSQVSDPFAQMAAPVPQMQQQMPVANPFAQPAQARDPFAAMPATANPFAAPAAQVVQNPFASAPYQPPTQLQPPSNPFA
mmetsp:Transcript_10451/g.34571  ORF Transcript_10451/g.34571 Transcript_10451/m.34571 type:complete len:403 (-) Transcript_10451:1187-2395(-)